MGHTNYVRTLIGVSTYNNVGQPKILLIIFEWLRRQSNPVVNSIQELFRVQALRQTMTNEPSVGILESSAEIDDEDDDNTILQASQGAELTANDESELTGKRRLQQVSTLADRHRIV